MLVRSAQDVLSEKHAHAKWATASERLGTAGFPIPRRRFSLPAGATVFTVGSCFARNIEEHLSLIGCKVPTLSFSVPKSEWRARSNGILNKYTPAAIYQEIAWAHRTYLAGGATPDDCNEMRWDLPDGRVIDLQLGGSVPVTEERFLQRRIQVYDLFINAFFADCVTITLGLIEAWRDRRTGLFVQNAPISRDLRRGVEEFEFVLLDYTQCYDFVRRTIEKIRELNRESRILITTSPVPMEKTFTQDDVVIANMTSKSILRSVADEVSKTFEMVDYFPSYEGVVLRSRADVFREDNIHVKDSIVGKIVQELAASYFEAPRNLNHLVQLAAVELGEESSDGSALRDLIASDPSLTELESDQLIIYLRACWRLRARARARMIAAEIVRRPDRSNRNCRAVKHIFPRVGCLEEARRYAEELLRIDPSDPIARELIVTAEAASAP